jgi:hypothetical protein
VRKPGNYASRQRHAPYGFDFMFPRIRPAVPMMACSSPRRGDLEPTLLGKAMSGLTRFPVGSLALDTWATPTNDLIGVPTWRVRPIPVPRCRGVGKRLCHPPRFSRAAERYRKRRIARELIRLTTGRRSGRCRASPWRSSVSSSGLIVLDHRRKLRDARRRNHVAYPGAAFLRAANAR